MRRGSDTHLFANYDTPAGSFAIQIPGAVQEGTMGRSIQHKPSGKVYVGGHKPRDTLNNGAFLAKTVAPRPSPGGHLNSRRDRTDGWQAPMIAPPSALAVAKSSGHNVPRPMELQGDGFCDDHTATRKKRKLEDGRSYLTSSSPTVVLIDDDATRSPHFDGVVLERTTYKSRPSLSDQEKSVYQISVGDFMEIKERKSRRKALQSRSSSQVSQHATLNGTPSTRERNGRITPEASIELTKYDDRDSDVIMSEELPRPAPAKSRSARMTTNVPPPRSPGSKLGEDGTDAAKVRAANAVLTGSMHRNAKANGRSKPALPERVRKNIEQVPRQLAEISKQQPAQVLEMSLNDKFIRDIGNDARQIGPRASQKMQAVSTSSRARVSLGSEDELAGETTVPSHTSRSTSPQKIDLSVKDLLAENRDHPQSRHQSPSDLKPTAFTASTKSQKKQKKQAIVDADIGNSIPVNTVICRSCCMVGEDLLLVWQGNTVGGYYVERNGEMLTARKSNEPVCIEGKVARQWVAASATGVLTVQIKGSQTIHSNGSIILGFRDLEGLGICYNALLHASHEQLKEEVKTKETMLKTIANITKDIQQDYKKHEAIARNTHDDLDLARMRQNKALRAPKAPFDPEDIRYEVDGGSSNGRARSKVQTDVSRNELSTSMTSRHFALDHDLDLGQRRSSRQARPVRARTPTPPRPPARWTRMNKPALWSQSVLYPSEGAPKRVTVDHQDLERLDEGEFLNDNIISFALRQIEETMAPTQKGDVLFFNSFFYTALSNKAGRKAFNYDAVKRWTKNIDVFTKPYIVVPINIDLHWFLAIICNLQNLKRTATGLDDEEVDDDEMLLEGDSEDRSGLQDRAVDGTTDGDRRTSETQESMRVLSISDHETDSAQDLRRHDDRTNDDDAQPQARTPRGRKSKKKAPPRQRTFDQDRPTIITLDSFGHARAPEIRLLKEYLVAEGEAKRGMSISLNDIQGVTAKGLPQQANFCDCGLFLVGYAEQFAKEPRQFITKVLQKTLKAEVDFADFDPSEKRAEIRNELLRLHEEQDTERLAKKRAKTKTDVVSRPDEAAQRPQAAVLVETRTQHTATTNEGAHAPTASAPYARRKESVSSDLLKSRLGVSMREKSARTSNSDPDNPPRNTARLPYSQLTDSEKDAFMEEVRTMREDDRKSGKQPNTATGNDPSYTHDPREVIEDSQECQHY